MALRILLADHHLMVRHGLRLLLVQQRLEIVAEARDDLEAAAAVALTRPDLAIIDAGLPRLGGLDAARRLRDACSRIRIILLGTIEEQWVADAFRHNVSGFLLKTQGTEELIHAISTVRQGGIYAGPQPAQALLQRLSQRADRVAESLSPRERQLLQLVAEGKTTKQAGAVLGITFKTAAYYRTRLMEKLKIHTTAGLVRYALQVNASATSG